MPLPKTAVPVPGGTVFQTKDTDDMYMTLHTITADGRLVWRPYEMETVPRPERPYPDDDGVMGLCGSMRRIERDPEEIPFHGVLHLYHYQGEHEGGKHWWVYAAKFTDGRCVEIALVEHT